MSRIKKTTIFLLQLPYIFPMPGAGDPGVGQVEVDQQLQGEQVVHTGRSDQGTGGVDLHIKYILFRPCNRVWYGLARCAMPRNVLQLKRVQSQETSKPLQGGIIK